MVKYFTGLLLLFLLAGTAHAQVLSLKKLKLEKNITAYYQINHWEYYQVGHRTDTGGMGEWAKTTVDMQISQDILLKKKNYLQVDYSLQHYNRYDEITKNNNTTDTASNRGKSPLIKIILQHNENGQYLGPVMDIPATIFSQRDFKYFYNVCKQMVLPLTDSSKKYTTWTTNQADTIANIGFEMVYKYVLKWETAGTFDTLGYKCLKINYFSVTQDYYAVDGAMKALGIETIHSGSGGLKGSLYVEAATGRAIAMKEDGIFLGEMTMDTPGEVIKQPTQYQYTKQFAITSVVKKKRKKFLGIF